LGLKKFSGNFLEKRMSKVNEKLFPGKYEIKGVFSFSEKNLPEIHTSVFWGVEDKKPAINPLEVLCIKNLTFDKNQFDLIPNGDTENLAVFLSENPSYSVRIEGHTDEEGGEEYNLFLSQKRATSLKKYLVKKGIAPEKISTVGFGEKKPLSKNAQENRRIEISFKKNQVKKP
jgi:outer membrane protein OmpA-like peptidoglycan-associated protein